ncbi:MAG: RNA 2',3'-cyclic phosphodiesterase [Methanobacteriota archaeon]
MRLFIAIPAPTEIRTKFQPIQTLISECGKIKPVEQENIHLTLKFIGEVGEEKLKQTITKLSHIENEQGFNITVSGLGAFPKPSHPKIIWAGTSEGSTDINNLHGLIDENLKPLGFKPEKRFHPHYTISRVKFMDNKSRLADILSEHENTEFGTYTCEKIQLIESKLTSKGPIYTVLKEYALS